MRVTNKTNFKAVEKKIRSAIGLYADTAAKKMEGHAKKNAPWYPVTKPGAKGYVHTGNARNSIEGNFGWKGDQGIITLSGNMEYSVFLELAMAKKYAILVPTIHQFSAEILRGYQRLVK